ncbi:hypothetical protein [Williamsia sp. CHRR-6]|uniref:hypothetical protein n=1 Tax=Williamsia sp. CHRR-6 TaxID=2835871 RepID=UPI001BD92856|nr:hypothetical protein [Williamsia sp. CHRR-6]MBT0568631.1 hypothetical protein [Williamsia sp. CHRR-6]
MWFLDVVTTIGATLLLAVGVILLARSGPPRKPTSAGHWFGLAILLFVAARFLHLPTIENEMSRIAATLDGHHQWYNIPYMLTITCTTVAIVYCVPAVAWLLGANVRLWPPHIFAGGSFVVMIVSFAASDLWKRPIDYLPAAFEWDTAQIVFWGYVATAIAAVGLIALALIAGTLRDFRGPIRLMMILIASSACTAVAFAAHIVLRVFFVKAAPGMFPHSYITNGSFIAVLLTTLVTVQLLGAFFVPLVVRLRMRIVYFQMLWQQREEWNLSRELDHRNVFDDLEIPETRWECWRAARTPVVARRMLFEMSTV